MTACTLDRPIALLQATHPSPQSWSTLSVRLLRLLNLYSTGLTFTIASHILTVPCDRTLPTAHLILTSRPPAVVWQLRLSDGTSVAHIPTPSHAALFSPPARLTLPAVPPPPTSDGADALRAVSAVLRSKRSPLTPADVRATADTSINVDDATSRPTTYLPRGPLLFDLSALPSDALPLPPQAYTLQSVWDARSLHPPALSAIVVERSAYPPLLRLQDPPGTGDSQPVVDWPLGEAYATLSMAIHPGMRVLLLNARVEPTASSFMVHADQDTVLLAGWNDDGSGIHRKDKNAEASKSSDNCLKKSVALVDVVDVVSAAHCRLVSVRRTARECQLITTAGLLVVPRGPTTAALVRGDELVALEVRPSEDGWVAREVTNLSTMTAVLFAPFVRDVVRVRAVRNRMITDGACTAHVCVRVRDVRICQDKDIQEVRLQVVDEKTANMSEGNIHVWEIVMRTRGFERLFRVAKDMFWMNAIEIVRERRQAVLQETWLMTLTCDGAQCDAPLLCACVTAASYET